MQKSLPIKTLRPDSINTLEEYAAVILISTAAIATVMNCELRVRTLGILEADEEETSKTIEWECKRLFNLLRKQLENVLERSPLEESQILEAIKKIHPGLING